MERRLAKLLERSRAETFDQRVPAKTRRRKRKHAHQDSVESTKSATSELFTMHRDTLREVLHDGRSVNDLLDVVASTLRVANEVWPCNGALVGARRRVFVWVNAGLLGSGTHRVVGDRSRIVPHWMGRLEECTCLLCANGVIGVVDDWACAGGWVAGGGVQRPHALRVLASMATGGSHSLSLWCC